jgi:hypothetical protein
MLRRWSILLLLCLGACSGTPNDVEPLPTLIPINTSQRTPTVRNTGELSFWQPVRHALDDAQSIDEWRFAAQAGDKITLRAIGQGITVTLKLLNPAGALIDQGRVIETQLAASGEYRVIVEGDGKGGYELGLSYTDQLNPSEIPPTPLPVVVGVPTPLPVSADLGTYIAELENGETVAGELTPDEDRHVYTYRGVSGQYLSIEMTRVSGELDPLLTLYDTEGVSIAVDANSGLNSGAAVRNILLTTDGFYTLVAHGRGKPGVYSIKLTAGEVPLPLTPTIVYGATPTFGAPALNPTVPAAVPGERLKNHQLVTVDLETPDDVQRHSFEVSAGEIITLGVIPAPDSPLIPRVELYDPDGVPVAVVSGLTSPSNREAIIPTHVASLTGPYTAFVTAEGETSGTYLIGYGVGTTYRETLRGEIISDQVVESTLDQPAVRDSWYAFLRQGDVITAAVEVTGGELDPVLELVSENGTLLAIDNSSGGTRKPLLKGVTLPATGLYYFRIRGTLVDNPGSYRLRWQYIDVAPTSTPPQGLTRILAVNDSVAENAYQFYPFQGRAGENLRITVAAEYGTSFDPVVALLDSDATVIVQGDDSEGSLNPQVYVTLPADGLYTVRVNGYLTSGNYEVIVEKLIPLD